MSKDLLGYMTHSILAAVVSIRTRGRAEVGTAEHAYDVVVLGAGPVGQNAAERARAGGLSVAMVERELVGGECSYWGCVPSKALLRPVIAVADADHIDGAREAVTGPINAAGVFGRRDRYVSNWDDAGQADWVAGIGATLVRGHGRLDGPRRVTVTDGRRRGISTHRPARCRDLHGQLVQRCRICRASPKPGLGPTAKPPTAARCLVVSPSSAPAVSASKWPPPGMAWAPR